MYIHFFSRLGRNLAFNPYVMSVLEIDDREACIFSSLTSGVLAKNYSSRSELEGLLRELPEDLSARVEREGFFGEAATGVVAKASQFELVLNVAQTCNLACSYCFSNNKLGTLMDFSTAKKAIDDIVDTLAPDIIFRLSFFGGEATLNFPLIEDVVSYHKGICEKHNIVSDYFIITNGYSLNERQIEFFGRYNFEVQISVDGKKNIHDKYRRTHNNQGTFDRVWKNIARLEKNVGVRLSTSSVISKDNNASEVYDLMSELNLFNMKLDMVYDFHDFGEPSFDSARSEFTIKYNAELEDVAKKYVDCVVNFRKPAEYNLRQSILLLWGKKKKSRYCPAGSSRLGLAADGKYYPCGAASSLQEFQIGEVKNGVNKNKSSKFDLILDVSKKEPCKSCWAHPLCLGGCPLTLRHLPDRNHCDTRKNTAEISIWAFFEIKNRNPLSFMAILDEGLANKFALAFKDIVLGDTAIR